MSRQEILKFLGRAAQAKHAVTLAILSDKGLRVFHDYRTGSDVLLAALAKTGLGGMKGVTPPPGVSEVDVSAEAARLTAFNKGEQSNPTPPEQMMRSNIDLLTAYVPGRRFRRRRPARSQVAGVGHERGAV